jgi:hypothetical protein
MDLLLLLLPSTILPDHIVGDASSPMSTANATTENTQTTRSTCQQNVETEYDNSLDSQMELKQHASLSLMSGSVDCLAEHAPIRKRENEEGANGAIRWKSLDCIDNAAVLPSGGGSKRKGTALTGNESKSHRLSQ